MHSVRFDVEKFLSYRKSVFDCISDFAKRWEIPQFVADHITRIISYTIVEGEFRLAKTVYELGYALSPKPSSSEPKFQQRCIALGWVLEMLQAAFQIIDDITGEAAERNGRPVWHRVKGVGLGAINDALLVESFAFHVIESEFAGDDSMIFEFHREIHESVLLTECALNIDLRLKYSQAPLSEYTWDIYKSIVSGKSTRFSLYLPMRLVGILAGDQEELPDSCQSCLSLLGELSQIRRDAFTNDGVAEIVNRKCTWRVLAAMQNAGQAQKLALSENFGKSAGQAQTVEAIYEELGLRDRFAEACSEYTARINAILPRVPRHPLHSAALEYFSTAVFK